jgi:hypothetical protein
VTIAEQARTPVGILREARARISEPSNLATGTLAWDDDGIEVEPYSSAAVHFCALGALDACFTSQTVCPEIRRTLEELLHQTAQRLYGKSLGSANDEDGHEAVMRIYRAAIEAAS